MSGILKQPLGPFYKAIFFRSSKRNRLWCLKSNIVVDSSCLHAAFLGKAVFTLRLIMVSELYEKWTTWFYISSTTEKIFKGAPCLLLKSILLVFNHNYCKIPNLAHIFYWLFFFSFTFILNFFDGFPSTIGKYSRVKYPCDCKYILPEKITPQCLLIYRQMLTLQ